MSAFFLSNVEVTNPEAFQEYASKAGKSMQAFGGELVIKGTKFRQLSGEDMPSIVAVVSFPSAENLNQWYDSAEYQGLIPLRDSAAKFTMTAFNIPTN